MSRIVANKGNGICVSTSDPLTCTPMPLDVVLIPGPSGPVPAPPVVNTAQLGDAINTATNVYINGNPVVVLKSEIPRSSGAPPNAIKGISSPPPANNKCTFLPASASTTVFANGNRIIRHRDTTAQNAGNCPGAVKITEAFCLTGSGIVLDSSMSNPEKEQVVSALERLAQTPRGNELLREMQNSTVMRGHNVTITVTSGGNSIGYANPADRFLSPPTTGIGPPVPGRGTNSTINFNPTRTYAGTPLERPPEVGLGHELVHGYHAAAGTQPSGTRLPGPTNVR